MVRLSERVLPVADLQDLQATDYGKCSDIRVLDTASLEQELFHPETVWYVITMFRSRSAPILQRNFLDYKGPNNE